MWDGIKGLKAISDKGGCFIAQDPEDALYKQLPELADEKVDLNFIGSAAEIGEKLISIASGRTCSSG